MLTIVNTGFNLNTIFNDIAAVIRGILNEYFDKNVNILKGGRRRYAVVYIEPHLGEVPEIKACSTKLKIVFLGSLFPNNGFVPYQNVYFFLLKNKCSYSGGGSRISATVVHMYKGVGFALMILSNLY